MLKFGSDRIKIFFLLLLDDTYVEFAVAADWSSLMVTFLNKKWFSYLNSLKQNRPIPILLFVQKYNSLPCFFQVYAKVMMNEVIF